MTRAPHDPAAEAAGLLRDAAEIDGVRLSSAAGAALERRLAGALAGTHARGATAGTRNAGSLFTIIDGLRRELAAARTREAALVAAARLAREKLDALTVHHECSERARPAIVALDAVLADADGATGDDRKEGT